MSRSRAVVSRRSRIAVCRDRGSRCRGDRGSRCVTLEDRGVSRLRIEDRGVAIEDRGVTRLRIEDRGVAIEGRGVANNYKRPKFCPVRRSIHTQRRGYARLNCDHCWRAGAIQVMRSKT